MQMLTLKQFQLLQYIETFMQTHRFAPSIVEMADGIEVKSSQTACARMSSLIKKVYISRELGKTRSIKILIPTNQAELVPWETTMNVA